jgi:hypothetical protein
VKRTNVVIKRSIRFWHRHFARLHGHSPWRDLAASDPSVHPIEIDSLSKCELSTSDVNFRKDSHDKPIDLENASLSDAPTDDSSTELITSEQASSEHDIFGTQDQDILLSDAEAPPSMIECTSSIESQADLSLSDDTNSGSVLEEDGPIVSEPLEMSLRSPTSPTSPLVRQISNTLRSDQLI